MTRPPSERRQGERLRLSESVVARLGTAGVVLVDLSDFGARIEHYERLKVGQQRILRLDWKDVHATINCKVVSSTVHRFATGDDGLTVFRSGLFFTDERERREPIRKLVNATRATTLAEQVANAKGFAPPGRGEMPIFRSGALSSNRFDVKVSEANKHLLPNRRLVHETGYIRFSLQRGRWIKIWTLDPTQPEEGFTVSADEAVDQVDLLCEQYKRGDAEGRELIRLLARTSLEELEKKKP